MHRTNPVIQFSTVVFSVPHSESAEELTGSSSDRRDTICYRYGLSILGFLIDQETATFPVNVIWHALLYDRLRSLRHRHDVYFVRTQSCIIAIGEMTMPTSLALVAVFAPAKMCGRYMYIAIAGISWADPSTIDPGAAGYLADNYNPTPALVHRGALCGISVPAYYALHLRLGARQKFAPAKEETMSLSAAAT
jgi:hypothetical protein